MISLHFCEKYKRLIFCGKSEILQKYNLHKSPYCYYVKNDRGHYRKCLACQRAVCRKCRKTESFFGVCHAGVLEYISRIEMHGETCGFVSVSGYRKAEDMPEKYELLNCSPPPEKLLSAIIAPLCIMVGEYIAELEKYGMPDNVYTGILSYLAERHAYVTLDELCGKFGCSRSYISHMFRKNSGYTIRQYCNLLKVDDAKGLLEKSDLSVTEVAYAAGFDNFSYFINVFRRITEKTPLKWRREKQLSG